MSNKKVPSLDPPTALMLVELAYEILEREPQASAIWRAADEWVRAQETLLNAIAHHQKMKSKKSEVVRVPAIILPGQDP